MCSVFATPLRCAFLRASPAKDQVAKDVLVLSTSKGFWTLATLFSALARGLLFLVFGSQDTTSVCDGVAKPFTWPFANG